MYSSLSAQFWPHAIPDATNDSYGSKQELYHSPVLTTEQWLLVMHFKHIASCRRVAATICAAQACNGSVQRQPWARLAELGLISQYAPSSSRLLTLPVDRIQSTDVRQHHRLMLPGRGHNNKLKHLPTTQFLHCQPQDRVAQ